MSKRFVISNKWIKILLKLRQLKLFRHILKREYSRSINQRLPQSTKNLKKVHHKSQEIS